MKGRVYTDYNPVRIFWPKYQNLLESEIDVIATKTGLTGNFESITDADIPNSREDRNIWKFENGKVKVDNAKKAIKDAEKQAKKQAKDSVLTKLGITEQELKDLLNA